LYFLRQAGQLVEVGDFDDRFQELCIMDKLGQFNGARNVSVLAAIFDKEYERPVHLLFTLSNGLGGYLVLQGISQYFEYQRTPLDSARSQYEYMEQFNGRTLPLVYHQA
jgi:hypothetical protein